MLSSIRRNLLNAGRSHLAMRRWSSTATTKRGEDRVPLNLGIGEVHNKFELLDKQKFEAYDFTLYKFKHQILGTVHYHIDSSDTNNCFAISFRTVPEDSTGKMHILEHLALCGSTKYPVRDPFMSMIKRSLNTYMNAWTGPDFTAYPFSTVNEKDFYNLMSVYGESVFNPLLRKTDFMQEGWRLEFEDPEDPESPLEIKGVVYNEMKGVYENPDNLFMESVQSLLMPGTPYTHDAGGKPSMIPSLTHEALKDFHKRTYHPSNGTIYSYGDLSPLKHQEYLETHFLKEFEKGTFPKPILTPTLTTTVRHVLSMPPPAVEIAEGKDSMFGVSFLCNIMGEDIKDAIGLNLLSHLLFETPKSPFYVDFLETGLADAFSPGHGYEGNIFPSFFTIGFKNIKRGSEADLEKKIFETLNKVAKEGLDKGLIDSALHQIELTAKVAQANFGLQIFQTYLGPITHNIDSIIKQGLNIEQVLADIREGAAKGYFENLLKKYFLENPKRLYLTLQTDVKYNEKLEEEEEKLIEKFESELTDAKKAEIVRNSKQLKEEQEAPQDLDLLPTLTVKDIPQQAEPTLFHKEAVAGVGTFFFHKPTNGVTHLRMKVNLAGIDHASVHQLYLLSLMLNKVGTTQHSYEEFHEKMQLHTSGFNLQLFYDGHPKDPERVNGFAVFSISCLDWKVPQMFSLLTEILTQPDFKDFEHVAKLIRLDSSAAASRIVERPLEFAIDYGIGSHRQAQQYFSKLSNVSFPSPQEPFPDEFRYQSAEGRTGQDVPGGPGPGRHLHPTQDVQAAQPLLLGPHCTERTARSEETTRRTGGLSQKHLQE